MPIAASDLHLRFSGGSSNSDPNASLGGAKSSTSVTDNSDNNLFDDVSGSESSAGDIEYRCLYVHNNHGTLTAQNTRIYISQDPAGSGDTWAIALDGAGLNATAEGPVANENTAPSGETFSAPTDYANGLSMGNIPAGQHYAFWIRRTITAGTGAANAQDARIKVDCDTAA